MSSNPATQDQSRVFMHSVPVSVGLAIASLLLAGCAAPTAESGVVPDPQTGVHLSHNYTSDAPRSAKFTITGDANVEIFAKIGGSGPSVCNSGKDAKLRLSGPGGDPLFELAAPNGTVMATTGDANSPCDAKVLKSIQLSAGEWVVEFVGQGVFVGTFDLEPAAP